MVRSKVRLILISQALFVHSLPIPITEPRGAVLKLIIYNPRAWMWELFSGERDVMCHPYKHPEREFIISHCEFRIANLSPNGSIQLSKRWRVTSIGGTPKIKLFIIQLQCIIMLPLFPNSSSVSGGGFYNNLRSAICIHWRQYWYRWMLNGTMEFELLTSGIRDEEGGHSLVDWAITPKLFFE